ncbi:MAG: hypothetical protein ABEJ92_01810 [Halobacteriales archaeon]
MSPQSADSHVESRAEGSSALSAPAVAVRLRNYDHHRGHAVRVTATDSEDQVAFADRVFLAAGQTTRMTATIDPADYALRVRVDGIERTTVTCRLDDTPSGTAVVELGNGAVSVTAGAER